MKNLLNLVSTRLAAVFVLAVAAPWAQAQVTATYAPANWTNDPTTPNPGFTITGPTTSSPSYVETADIDYNQNMYGYSPIGSTVTLTAPGTSVILSTTVDLSGSVNNANLQFRYGILYKGSSPNDENWGGVLIPLPNTGGQPGLYDEKLTTTGAIFSTGASANTEGSGTYVNGSQAGPMNYTLSVTYLTPTTSLECWTVQGLNGNAYAFYGRYTNTTTTAMCGYNFDTVGFLKGGSVFSANSTANTMSFSNVQVVVGAFSDGIWSTAGSGTWSVTNNWANGAAANGTGFFADFSQVNLPANGIVTLDSSRNIAGLIFGATSGSTFNWLVTNSGGSILSLNNNGLTTEPNIAVNQNTTTLALSVDSTNGLSESGPGTLVLAGDNTILGPLNLNGGELSFSSLANLPLSSSGTGISSITFGGGTLQFGPGNTLDISALNVPISFAGNGSFDTGANNVTFADSIGDGGPGSLTKLGTGTLTFDGAVANGGSTVVSNGVLALGSAGSLPNTTNIVVLSGATLNVSASGGLTLNANEGLSGAGTIIGNVSDATGAVIGSGYASTGAAGTLAVNGNLSLNGGATFTFGLSSSTTPAGGGVNDLIAVTGALHITGQTAINVDLINGAPGLGMYTLFTYTTFSGSIANLTPPLGFSVTNTGNSIGLVVTHVPESLIWLGDGTANNWDTDTTANWTNLSGTAEKFFAGDSVTFNSAGSDNPYINLVGAVEPASVTVSSSGYDFAGSGAIATGTLSLTSGTLILENNNTYAGPTVISSGGVLQVGGPNNGGNSGTLGTGGITNNGALVFDLNENYTVVTNIAGAGSISNIGGTGTITLSGNVSGSTVTMAGTGALVLSGSNTYTGQTIVSGGSLQLGSSNALGSGTAGASVSNGAQLYITANVNLATKPLNFAGTGNNANGALEKGGNGVSYVGNPITLTGDTLIEVDGGSTLYLTNSAGITAPGTNLFLGAASGGAGYLAAPFNLGPAALTAEGAGTWTIAPTNTFTGGTVLEGGILRILSSSALGPVTANPAFVSFNGGTLGATNALTNTITFNDGLRGFTVNSTGDMDVAPSTTLIISNQITGAGTLTKSDSGTLVLSGSNTFSGTLNVDTDNNVNNDGVLIVTTSNAIADVASPIALQNSLGGSSTFEVIGTNGNVGITQDFTVSGRSPNVAAILSSAGTNTLSGSFTFNGGGQYYMECDSGLLTMGSATNGLTYTSADPQTLTFRGNGTISVAGVISDGTVPTSIAETGNGALVLGAVNTYTGSTTVSGGTLNVSGTIATGGVTLSGGTLSGTGAIGGPVSVGAAATFAPGAPLGTLTLDSTLSLAGTTSVAVNSGASSQVTGLTSVTYGGTLTVTNLGGPLTTNSSFTLFSAAAETGNFTSIGGVPGVTFSFKPSSGVLSVVSVLPTSPTNITYSVKAGAITLSWPSSYTGWILQAQTNAPSVGITTNWVNVANSASTNTLTFPISTTNDVFFRLIDP